MSPTSISSSVIRSGTTRPTSLSRMKVPIAENTITQSAVSACQPSRCSPPPEIVPARVVSAIALLAKMPTRRPPASAGEAVGVDDAEGVVDVAERLRPAQVVEREVDERAGDYADDDRAPAVDETGAGGDRDEADDHAVDAADQARLAPGRVVPSDPDQEGDGGAEVGVEHGGGGDVAGRVPVTAVEAVPAQPEQAGPDGDHRQVVRRVDLAVALQARPDHPCRDEAGDSGGEVDHVAAGEVNRAVLGEVAAAPDQEGVDRVDEDGPEGDERDPRFEVDPPEHRAQHQHRRDRGEDDLEVGERRLREFDFFGYHGQQGDVAVPELAGAAQDRAWLAPHIGQEAAAVPPRRCASGCRRPS